MIKPEQLIIEIRYKASSDDYFMRLKPLAKRVWLDSGKPAFPCGKYDILSAAPSKVLINPSAKDIEHHVLQLTDQHLLSMLAQHDMPFWGGAIGYFNYEYNAHEFGLTPDSNESRPSVFGIFEWALVQNHFQKKTFLVFLPTLSQEKRDTIIALVGQKAELETPTFRVDDLHNDISRTDYGAAFETIKHYICAGDTYQINYSQRFSGKFTGAPDATYLALRRALPSPHSAYIELADDVVLSLSPERFIEIENGAAKTQPIKGTAPRSADDEQDKALADTLYLSEKNRAENLMIVDLLRNDFSKSCEPFSVEVPELFALQSFTNVHHLVSTVVGKLQQDVSPLDFFMRCFPGGSITGAPKKRAMEIIDELEVHPRNIYCGSVCYLSTTGRLDSNIAIRTLLVSKENIFCWGGGGIVADSNQQEEFEESLQKINVLINTLKG